MGSAPSLGVVEIDSIARGFVVVDVMLKRAEVRVLQSRPVSPGKYIVIVEGAEEEVAEAMGAAVAAAESALVDQLYLAQAHEQLAPVIAGELVDAKVQSLAILETTTVASTITSADAACKAAEVELIEMRLARGLGGKGFFTLTGELHMVEAAVEAAVASLQQGQLLAHEVIANPHGEMAPTWRRER